MDYEYLRDIANEFVYKDNDVPDVVSVLQDLYFEWRREWVKEKNKAISNWILSHTCGCVSTDISEELEKLLQ